MSKKAPWAYAFGAFLWRVGAAQGLVRLEVTSSSAAAEAASPSAKAPAAIAAESARAIGVPAAENREEDGVGDGACWPFRET